MGQVTGLGGVFIKAKDPKGLASWYQQYLGIKFEGSPYVVLPFTGEDNKVSAGYNILSFFNANADYFNPSEKQAMLNLRVSDLTGLLEQLKKDGVTLVGEPVYGEYGNFGWILDPEENKIELWEPPAE